MFICCFILFKGTGYTFRGENTQNYFDPFGKVIVTCIKGNNLHSVGAFFFFLFFFFFIFRVDPSQKEFDVVESKQDVTKVVSLVKND